MEPSDLVVYLVDFKIKDCEILAEGLAVLCVSGLPGEVS